jgi:sterol desaturase/sphingolipid hydroxylase (fatty acid hydroxylase superfamily)
VFSAAMLGAAALLHAGVPHGRVSLLVVVPAAIVILVMERVLPFAEAWSTPHDDVPADWTHLLLSQLLPPPLVEAALLTLVATTLATDGLGWWPAGWPLLAQTALAALIGELGSYAWHRLCYEHPLAWRLHAVHHSAERLYWLNAGRFHPLDTVVSVIATVGPLLLLGAGADVLTMLAVFTAVHGMFQHANLDIRLGWLNHVFSMAELHRWHHSRNLADANANYGANLIVWDHVFRTRHLPLNRSIDPRDIGFDGVEPYPRTYLEHLVAPLRTPAVADDPGTIQPP